MSKITAILMQRNFIGKTESRQVAWSTILPVSRDEETECVKQRQLRQGPVPDLRDFFEHDSGVQRLVVGKVFPFGETEAGSAVTPQPKEAALS